MSKIYNVRPVNKSLCLEQLCESNYRKLLTLIPNLLKVKRNALGYCANKPNLYIKIIERAPYTITLELSHHFNRKLSAFFEPAVNIRIYLDARLVEVLRDHERTHVSRAITDPGLSKEIMDYKWTLNYFLDKWLDHCLSDDYHFIAEPETLAKDYLSLRA
jgi:uncharacterized protein YqiB (DUF1249 family)